jgi:AraC family transcriptional regulator
VRLGHDCCKPISTFQLGRLCFDLPPLCVLALGVNYGPTVHLERGGGWGRGMRFKPGHLAIIPPDRPTRWKFDRVCSIVAVCFAREVLDRVISESTHRDPQSIEIVPRFAIRDLIIERAAHQLLRELVRPEPGAAMRVQAHAHDLAAQLLRAHSNLAQPLDRQARTIPPHKLKRVKDFICANLARDMSLAEVAAVADMTLFHFAKAFQQATGTSPHRYLIEHRILRARSLLHNPSLTIRTVAAAVGFTHSHFTRLFGRYMGMTPSAFRRLLQW